MKAFFWPRVLMVFALACSSLLPGCGVGPFPGGRLDGPERSLSAIDANALPDVSIALLETRPAVPYSVRVQLFRIDGALYVDPAPERRWYRFIEADPRVRIRVPDDTTIYTARAVPEEASEVLDRFADDLVILRLDPD